MVKCSWFLAMFLDLFVTRRTRATAGRDWRYQKRKGIYCIYCMDQKSSWDSLWIYETPISTLNQCPTLQSEFPLPKAMLEAVTRNPCQSAAGNVRSFILQAFIGAIAIGDMVKSTLGPKGQGFVLKMARVRWFLGYQYHVIHGNVGNVSKFGGKTPQIP